MHKMEVTEEIKKLWLSWDGREIKTDGRDKKTVGFQSGVPRAACLILPYVPK